MWFCFMATVLVRPIRASLMQSDPYPMQNRFVFRFLQNIDDQVLRGEFFCLPSWHYTACGWHYFFTRVVTLQFLTFTVNVCYLIINMLSFFCICGLDSSLKVSHKLCFSYKYNLTFSCFCKYLLFKIENMEVVYLFRV